MENGDKFVMHFLQKLKYEIQRHFKSLSSGVASVSIQIHVIKDEQEQKLPMKETVSSKSASLKIVNLHLLFLFSCIIFAV